MLINDQSTRISSTWYSIISISQLYGCCSLQLSTRFSVTVMVVYGVAIVTSIPSKGVTSDPVAMRIFLVLMTSVVSSSLYTVTYDMIKQLVFTITECN